MGDKLSRKDQALVDGLMFCSGDLLFARDLCWVVNDMRSISISPKGIGKRMVWLEHLGYVERRPFNSSEALYNRCRYAYQWVPEELR